MSKRWSRNRAVFRCDEDRVLELDHTVVEIVEFHPPTRTQGGWMVDVRAITTGKIWYGVWLSRLTPMTRAAREQLGEE